MVFKIFKCPKLEVACYENNEKYDSLQKRHFKMYVVIVKLGLTLTVCENKES